MGLRERPQSCSEWSTKSCSLAWGGGEEGLLATAITAGAESARGAT